MKEKVAQALQRALQGSRKVKITFTTEGTEKLHYLVMGMKHGGMVLLPDDDYMMLRNTLISGKWPFFHKHKRTTTVTLTDKFDEKLLVDFTNYMSCIIEKIEVVIDN